VKLQSILRQVRLIIAHSFVVCDDRL
jgi:hypothetical protein